MFTALILIRHTVTVRKFKAASEKRGSAGCELTGGAFFKPVDEMLLISQWIYYQWIYSQWS